MKIKTIGNPEIIMHNPASMHNYFAWPSVARLKDGKIAIACSGLRLSHVCPFGKALMITSDDEGNTYSPMQIVMDTILDDRDAGLTPFGENGLIVTSFNHPTQRLRDLCVGTDEQKKYMNAYMDMITPEMEKGVQGSTYRVSYDNGKTWDMKDNIIYTNPNFTDNFDTRMRRWDMGYPATVELDDGSLLTVFYIHPTEEAPAVIMQQKWSF